MYFKKQAYVKSGLSRHPHILLVTELFTYLVNKLHYKRILTNRLMTLFSVSTLLTRRLYQLHSQVRYALSRANSLNLHTKYTKLRIRCLLTNYSYYTYLSCWHQGEYFYEEFGP